MLSTWPGRPTRTGWPIPQTLTPTAPNGTGRSPTCPRSQWHGGIKYRYDGLGWRGDAHFHLFVVNSRDGECRQVTDGDWDDVSPVWAPDGNRIAFISGRGENRDISSSSEAYVVEVSEEGASAAELWSDGLETVGNLAWSPDGQQLAAAGSPAPTVWAFGKAGFYLLEPGKPPQKLTDDTVRPTLGIPAISPTPEMRWHKDGRIQFLGEARGESYLMETTMIGGETRRVAGGGMMSGFLALDSAGKRAAIVSNSPPRPPTCKL